MTQHQVENTQLVQLMAAVFDHSIANPRGDGFNIDAVMKLSSAVSSSQYAMRHMTCAKRLTKQEIVEFSLKAAPAQGLVLEFGVFSGKSINRIAEHYAGPIYGFDSFEGLPEDWRGGYEKGAFARPDLPEVAANVELIVGWFDRTLLPFLDAHEGPVSFLHVDCDLYSSTQTVLMQLRQRLQVGTIILFDEYFNYPGWEIHEFRAFQEFIVTTGIQYEYIALNPDHQQVAVRLTYVPAA